VQRTGILIEKSKQVDLIGAAHRNIGYTKTTKPQYHQITITMINSPVSLMTLQKFP
jgi:hypothetical protein